MPTLTRFATAYSTNEGTVINPSNAYADIGSSTYAEVSGECVTFKGFNFSDIPDGSAITMLRVTVDGQLFRSNLIEPYDSVYANMSFHTSDMYTDPDTIFTVPSYSQSSARSTPSIMFSTWNLSKLKTDANENQVSFSAPYIYDSIQTLRIYGIRFEVSFNLPTYAISSSAGTGGTISPSGTTNVTYGNSQTYTITSNSGYAIETLTVDGVSVTPASSYTFSNVTTTHSISATFKQLFNPTIAAAKQSEWFLKGR